MFLVNNRYSRKGLIVLNIVITSNITRGLYNFRRELIETLAHDHNVTILSYGENRVQELKDMGCSFVEMPIDSKGTNPINDLKLLSTYKKHFTSLKPDIVLTYTIKPNIYAGMACASLGIPYIANITGLGTAVENGGILQKITIPLYKRGLKKAKKVFFQNKANMDFMVNRGIVNCPYELIPGSGVNLDRFKLLEYPNGDTIDFTFIGRIIKQKGIDQFIDAAKSIRNNHPETRFHVCGKCSPEYENIINELNDKGIIIYHGVIDDIPGMHSISSCTIHPSYYPEGMSNVLLESCACGRPIITTNRPGCKEIVDSGINGFLVNQKDSEDLISKIEQFLSLTWQERKQMGLSGRIKVEREFDRNLVINAYLEAIKL